MSRENVELVRAAFEAVAQGDLERVFASLDPDIEWDVSRRQLEPATFRGHAGVLEFLRLLSETWSEQRFEVEEYVDAGDEVVVVIRFVSTARGSGVTVPARAVYVWQLRNGLAVRATMYQTKADALAAVGLRGS